MGAMIEKVHIMNFRSLKDIKFDFGDYTVLIGKNNSGKSNIIHALELANIFSPFFSESINFFILSVSTRVLPLPAPAITNKCLPSKSTTFCCCDDKVIANLHTCL